MASAIPLLEKVLAERVFGYVPPPDVVTDLIRRGDLYASLGFHDLGVTCAAVAGALRAAGSQRLNDVENFSWANLPPNWSKAMVLDAIREIYGSSGLAYGGKGKIGDLLFRDEKHKITVNVTYFTGQELFVTVQDQSGCPIFDSADYS